LWITLWLSVAHATPSLPVLRINEPLRDRRYQSVIEGPPPYPRRRASQGPIHGWTFPDGALEHYERLERGKIVERVRYDALGQRISAVHLKAGAPADVVIGAVTLPVASWTAHQLGAATVLAPADARLDGAQLLWTAGDERAGALWLDERADILSDAFRDELATFCGCVLVDRWAAWIDGAPGVVYRARMSDLGAPAEAHVWAVSRPTGTLLFTSIAPSQQPGAVASAMVALVEWTP